MLVLTRRIGERIVIGDRIVLEVISVRGNRVRLGIEAPADVTVLRGELLTSKVPATEEDVPIPQFIDIVV